MRSVFCARKVAAGLVLGASLAHALPLSAEVPWTSDAGRARQESRARSQPVLLDFWATWCGPCGAMDQLVFSQERVAAAMKKVLPVRIDIDRQADISRKYEVEATPTLIVIDGYGNELFRHRGALTADQLVSIMEALPADISRINALAAAIDRNKNDAASLRALADELRTHQLWVASSDAYRRALKTRAGRAPTEERAAMLLALGRNQVQLRQFDEANQLLAQLLREYPSHPDAAGLRAEIAAGRK